jgi:hypothetical protein
MIIQLVALLIAACLSSTAKEIVWSRYDNNSLGMSSIVLSEINKHGLTITSARIHNASEDMLPEWVYRMIPQPLRILYKDGFIFRGREKNPRARRNGSYRSCYIELFGTIPKTRLSEGNGNLTLSSADFTCLFVHSWVRREGLVAGDTIRPVYIICAPESTLTEDGASHVCNSIERSSENLNANLTLLVDTSKRIHTYFTLTSPTTLQMSHRQIEPHELGVVAIAPYIETNEEAAVLIANWIFYHLNLGFRVFLFDRNGSYSTVAHSAVDKFSKSKDVKVQNDLKRRFIYHMYSIRELLGYEDIYQRHARTDQDKALTYSHARFEYQSRTGQHSSLRDVKSLLVIDFDEVVFCPSAEYNASDQYKSLIEVVNVTRQNKADEVVFGRFAVNNISELHSCLRSTFEANLTAFSCYDSWQTGARHSTIKSMHHTFACPSTDFHFSCTAVCNCKRQSQKKCALFHLRPDKNGRKDEERSAIRSNLDFFEESYFMGQTTLDLKNSIDFKNKTQSPAEHVTASEQKKLKRFPKNELSVIWKKSLGYEYADEEAAAAAAEAEAKRIVAEAEAKRIADEEAAVAAHYMYTIYSYYDPYYTQDVLFVCLFLSAVYVAYSLCLSSCRSSAFPSSL